MQNQTELIWNIPWDIMIIPDATRYDIFRDIYREYFSGNVIPVLSPAQATPGWLYFTFRKYYPIIYISANPYVNSLGVECADVKPAFKATRHFAKIINTWNHGFNRLTGRIEPKFVYRDFIKNYSNNNRYRYIVHFCQPHAPYTTNVSLQHISRILLNLFIHRKKQEKLRKAFNKSFKNLFPRILQNTKDYYYKKQDSFNLYDNYTQNLRTVLSYIRLIVGQFKDKNIVITSDHGEMLGEDGRYGHGGLPHAKLNTVPWLFIGSKQKKNFDDNYLLETQKEVGWSKKDEECVKKRLRALGYL
jgi:hypothetical protein